MDTEHLVKILPEHDLRDRIGAAFEPHAAEKLSKLLWRNPDSVGGATGAGKPPLGVILAIQFAISDYIGMITEGMPPRMRSMIAYPVERSTPLILQACVSDEDWPAVEAEWLVVAESCGED